MTNLNATDYLGLIATIAFRWWHRFPPHLQQQYLPEDLISEITVQLLSRRDQYKAKKGKVTTFVWALATNHCKTMISNSMLKKRRCYEVDLDAVVLRPVGCSENQWVEAKESMEQLLRFASDDLRRAIAQFLQDRSFSRFPKQTLPEFQQLARQHRVSPNALRLVFARV